MTREDILRMARAAEIPVQITGGNPTKLQIQRFAELVAAAEREACALVCEQWFLSFAAEVEYNEGCMDCAKAIRARGDA